MNVVKKLIVVEVINPKGKGPYAHERHLFDPDNYTIETAKESLTRYGFVIKHAYLEA